MESGLLARSILMTNSSVPVLGRTAGDYADAERVLSTKKPTAPAGTEEDAGGMASRGRPPAAARFDGKTIKTLDSGLRRNDGERPTPASLRSDREQHRDGGEDFPSAARHPGIPSFRRRPESRTGARGGKRAFPAIHARVPSPDGQGQVATRPCGTFARRRAGWEYGAKDNHRGLSLRFAPRHRRARERGAYMRPLRAGGDGFVGAVREPPVFRKGSHRRRRVVHERPLRNGCASVG